MQQLLPQDILLAVRLLDAPETWTFESAGALIGVSASQCHMAFRRLCRAELIDKGLRVPIRSNLLEFLTHGVRYVFPADLGKTGKGIPTGHSAPVWKGRLIGPADEHLIWEHPKGKTTGTIVTPLYKTVPTIALQNEKTYAIMSIIDSLRCGKARERKEAANLLKEVIYDE